MNALESLVQHEIEKNGPISVARFMELALYTPMAGYYERRQSVGKAGDFFTNASVGGLFGELLACQFAHWLEPFDSVAGLQIVEAGAHEGRLAADILNWLRRHRPALFSRLHYCIVEPSASQSAWQKEFLSNQFDNVKWFAALAQLAPPGVNGVIFSNELLDAMPVHRLAWDRATGKWIEWRVGCVEGRFCWQVASLPAPLASWLPVLPPALEAVLPDRFAIEISPQASQWWEQAARILRRGTLVTIDYGLTQQEWIQPERPHGTLRSYSKHHLSASILDHVGQQDITAHVNFSELQGAGERAGLKTAGLIGQGRFLTQIVQLCQADPALLEPWTPTRLRQLATLTHPEHLGERFRVLIQTRGGGARISKKQMECFGPT